MKDDPLIKQSRILKGPYEVALDITNECNYRCLHCYNASGENSVISDTMSDDQFLELIEDICQMKPYNVCFCGGEPMMRLEILLKSADLLASSGINSISMVSNGYFIDEQTAKELYAHNIGRVQISLDGSNNKTCGMLRRNNIAFDKAINAIRELKKYNFDEINVAFCPTAFNIGELKAVSEICQNMGIRQIRVQPLMSMGRATSNKDSILPTREQYLELLRIIYEINLTYKKDNTLFIEWGDPLDHIFRYKDILKNINTFVSIKANGSIAPSPYLPISVGNVKKHKLSEYWNCGLPRAWSLPQVKRLADNIMCIEDMGGDYEGVPNTWFDTDLEVDIIDEKLFPN